MLTLSASQIKQYLLCPRSWHYKSIQKLDTPSGSASTEFGKVLHNVLERYINREDELYPEGWHNNIAHEHREVCRRLVKIAIDEGHVQQYKDGQAERKIDHFKITPLIDLVGYVDGTIPHKDEIVDFKTTESTRYHLSTRKNAKNFIGKDIQMLIYGYVYLQENPKCEEVTLTHLYLRKKAERVHSTSMKFTRKEIEDNFNKMIVPVCEKMLIDADINFSIADTMLAPKDYEKACKAFGGCSFLGICSGTKQKPKQKEENTMGIKDRLAKFKQKATTLKKDSPEPEEIKNEDTPGAADASPAQDTNTEVKETPVEETPTSDNPEPAEEPVKKKRRSREEIEKEKIEKALELLMDKGYGISAPGVEMKFEEAEKGVDVEEPVKSTGFGLYINCCPTAGPGGFLHIDKLFDTLISAMAEEAGKSYWELDTFKRREMFITNIDVIIDEQGLNDLQGILVPHTMPETNMLVSALVTRAAFIVQGN